MEEFAAPKTNNRFSTTETHVMSPPIAIAARIIWGAIILLVIGLFVFANIKLFSGIVHGLLKTDNAAISQALDLPYWLLDTYVGLLNIASFIVFVAVAIVLYLRRSNNWLALLYSLMLATFGGITINQTNYILLETSAFWAIPTAALGTLGNTLFVIFLYTFPDGHFSPRWSKWIGIPGAILIAIGNATASELIKFNIGMPILTGLSFAIYAGSVALQQYRFSGDRATSEQLQQVKWIVGGLGAAFMAFILWSVMPVVFPALTGTSFTALIFRLAAKFVVIICMMLIPLTIGFSMMRFRLWEVDFILNRGMVYGGLTLFLIIVTLGDLVLFQQIFIKITGREQAAIALAAAAGLSGVLFQPMRKGLQKFVDKKIYGIQVDYHDKPRAAPQPLPAVMPEITDKMIGTYPVKGLIGRGGMAEVYKGIHPTLSQTVAIKVMRAEQADRADFKHRFQREARTVAGLRHPNIIHLYDFGEHEGTLFMVMEYIDGEPLNEYIREHAPLAVGDALLLLGDIASALDYAHEQGIVHRDIKPSNVMLRRSRATGMESAQQAVLMDFGIARILGGATALTKTGMVGTLDYIAPEQIRDAKDVDGRADVYSLGIMAFEMLTGKLPFVGSNPGAVLISHLQQPPPDPRDLRADVPPAAARAILKALEKDPAKRFTLAGDFVAAMQPTSEYER